MRRSHKSTMQVTYEYHCSHSSYNGVARVSRIDKIIGLFCRSSSLSWGSFAKETYNLIDPTDRSHPILHCASVCFDCVCLCACASFRGIITTYPCMCVCTCVCVCVCARARVCVCVCSYVCMVSQELLNILGAVR